MRGVLILALLSAAAVRAPARCRAPTDPDATGPARLELVLPAASDRSAPAELLRGLAASRFVPAGNVRPARRDETGHLFVEARLCELAVVPELARTLEAIGVRTVTLQMLPDGDMLRLVASVGLTPGAPGLPLTNRELIPPAMDGGPGPCAWAATAVSFDAERLIPWLLAVAARRDEFEGRFLRDALAVIRWNLGLDLERDVARVLGGTIRLRAAAWAGADEASLTAEVRSAETLEKMLAGLAAGSQVMGKAGPRLDPARFADAAGYRLRLPWKGIAPALAIVRDRLVAETRPYVIESDMRGLIDGLSPVRGAELPRLVREVGHLDRCAVVVVDVLSAVRAARQAARLVGQDETVVPAPRSITWADGRAALAVRLGEDGIQAFGAWVAGRSALGRSSDDWIACALSRPRPAGCLMPGHFRCKIPAGPSRR